MVTWSELASSPGGRPFHSVGTPLLDETLKCLAEVTGAASAVVLTVGPRRSVLGSAGESLDAIGLRLSSRGAPEAEPLWIADASKSNGVAGTTCAMSVAILPLAPSSEGDPAILLLTRKSAGEWPQELRRRVEAFLPLIRTAVLDALKNPVLDENGRVAAMQMQFEEERAEHLLASESRFRQMADATPVMIWMTNANGEAEFQNRRMLAFMGARDGERLGHAWAELIHPDDRDRVLETVREAHERRKEFQTEMRLCRRDGEYRELLSEGAPRYSADGTFEGFAGSFVDLTDRRRLERCLDEDRRLSSLGRLAATIAHEMNNVLMAIQPFAEVIRKNRTAEALDRAADHIENAVQRGARITHEILRFANSSEPVLMPVDPIACLGAHHHELATILGPGIDLVVDVDPTIRLLADPHLMQQVFVNLASNARDAMRGAGTFTIRAVLEGDSQRRVAHFTVSDTGAGIPPNIAEKVFEPLFTTKTSGTGLGLSIARDIVKKHGGTLTIDTAVRNGTRFHILLPATDQEPAAQEQSADTLPPSVRRILLVEDDVAVASGMTALLEVEGAMVHVVDRGALALDAVDSFEPDLVILDIGLPDGPGTLVFDGIRRRHPNLPVLFSTGHAGELEAQVAHFRGPTAYLLKPYDFSAVIEAIRRLV